MQASLAERVERGETSLCGWAGETLAAEVNILSAILHLTGDLSHEVAHQG